MPKIKLVTNPTMAPPIGPVKAAARIVPITSKYGGNFSTVTICPPTKLMAIQIGINKIVTIPNFFIIIFPPLLFNTLIKY